MNIYSRKQRWKILLFITAVVIVVLSLWYTNILVRKIADDERQKVKLWADAIRKKAHLVNYTNVFFNKLRTEERKKVQLWAEANKALLANDLSDYTFALQVIADNTTVPVILTDDKGKILSSRNLDSSRAENSDYLAQEIKAMKALYEPIEIPYFKGLKHYIYYKDSHLFTELKTVFDGLIQSLNSEVTVNSAGVPVIYTDSSGKNIIASGNIDTLKLLNEKEDILAEMAAQHTPIEIDLGEYGKNYVFYKDSFLLTQLKYYPYAQFGVIGLFLLIAYLLFSTARRAEQNQVWVGMAKETAHQLGTPLSSLLAWLELLKAKSVDAETISEIEKDLRRLGTITERFSKIGSAPVLEKQNVVQVMEEAVNYIKSRTSRNVAFIINAGGRSEINAAMNVPLFEWVVENICKNAVDAMNGKGGNITVDITDQTQFIYIDISDTGKGIPKSKFKTIFEPGYTSKQRGWGLGLSLAKRIIKNYHNGNIFVKSSEINKGTTFRIVLNK